MSKKDHDPRGLRLPIEFTTTSTSEYEPIPLEKRNRLANELAFSQADSLSKRLGLSRRKFLVGATGAASSLLAFNEVNQAFGKTGGFFDLSKEAALDENLAKISLESGEFILDVHGHFVNPAGDWVSKIPEGGGFFFTNPAFSSEVFVREVFQNSDTDMMVLTLVPSMPDAEPLTIEEAAATREIVKQLDGTDRLLLHGRVSPNIPEDLDRMKSLVSDYGVSAWKSYPQWGPAEEAYGSMLTGGGYSMTDDNGLAFIEAAIASGVKVICLHKGIPFGRGENYQYARCDDIGPVAAKYPDVDFLIYHSGYDPAHPEGAYSESGEVFGVDTLVRSLQENGVAPNSNVYADLGSTWAMWLRDMNQAAHGLGKLLKYVGESNVLWGTDCIWYGSPQAQIQAFRAFQISEELQEAHGYPALTADLKAKVFGLNAMKPYGLDMPQLMQKTAHDGIAQQKLAFKADPNPTFQTYGPKTRREFLNMKRNWG